MTRTKPQYPADSMTVKAFAAMAGVDKTTVQRAIDSGYLGDGAVKIGTVWRIFPDTARANWAKYFKRSAHSTPALIAFLDSKATHSQQPAPVASKVFTEEQWAALTISEARLRLAVSKAKAAQMDLDEREGNLVPRAEVMAALFSFAQVARSRLEQLPVQLVDAIDAAPTRHAKLEVANGAVRAALTFLADLEGGDLPLKMGRS